MVLGWRERIVAGVLALTLHIAFSISIFDPSDWSGTTDPGVGGIEISLGPEGGFTGAPDTPELERPAEVEPELEAPAVEETPEPPPVAETLPEPVVKPTLVDQPHAEPVTAAPEPTVDTPPAVTAIQPEGNEGGGQQDSPVVGSADSAGGAVGNPEAEANYASALMQWLEQHKRYPRISRRRREEAVIVLFIAIDAEGAVLEVRLDEPSRYDRLNDAAIEMVERASPLPPIPVEMALSRLELRVPVQFFMNRP